MLVGVVRETFPGERRVALTPMVVTELRRSGFGVVIEAGAGLVAGFPDRLSLAVLGQLYFTTRRE